MPNVQLQNKGIKKIPLLNTRFLTDQDGINPQSTDFYKDSSNRSLREEGSSGDGVTRPGLRINRNKRGEPISYALTHMDVPQFAAGFPRMILSETPVILSCLPNAEASNKWSVVFSNDASMSTLSFIFETPNRVIPSTWPY